MLTAVWPPDLAPLVARIMAVDADAARRLALAPLRMVHMMAIWMRHAVAAGMEPDVMAAQIVSRDARDLLRDAMPDRSPRLPAYLDRVGSRIRPPHFYVRLSAVLDGPGAAALRTAGELRSDDLDAAELAAEAGLLVIEVARSTGASSADLKALVTVLSFLRAHGLAHDIEGFPTGAGWRSVYRRVLADLCRGRATLPDCPAPEEWTWVETVAQLRDIGRKMRVCVASLDGSAATYIHDMVAGRVVFIYRPSMEPVLAALRSSGAGLWALTEVVTDQNRPVPLGTTAQLCQALRATGLPVLPAPVETSLALLAQSATPARERNRWLQPNGWLA